MAEVEQRKRLLWGGNEPESLAKAFLRVRARTEQLASRLSSEDQGLQSMPDCSPTKWHRAHTTWFFEEFLLTGAGVPPFNPEFSLLFNSYYEAVGPRHPRPKRGLLSRPSADEVTGYRRAVDGRVVEWLSGLSQEQLRAVRPLIELGLAHEQQHQELILTDTLNAFGQHPLKPMYLPATLAKAPVTQGRDGEVTPPLSFQRYPEGLYHVGTCAEEGFCFDNETPISRFFLEPFELAERPVVMGEVRAFIEQGGYRTPALWLAEGIDWVRRTSAQAPMYSELTSDGFRVFTLHGERLVSDDTIASHLNFYEADAIARFLGARLPTEVEWEVAARITAKRELENAERELVGADLDTFVPGRVHNQTGMRHLFGHVWEWTASAYAPYPGYQPAAGAVGEYNGKFMVNQLVLRGGSCLTPEGHIRPTYRNFWPAHTGFQMTGARLARSI